MASASRARLAYVCTACFLLPRALAFVLLSPLPPDLARFLPAESVADAPLIAGNLTMQLSYPIGSPTRIGIQNAYGNSQRIMLISATAITVLGFPAVAIWRAIDTRKRKQVKGRVL